jgi:hypothetical protein
MLRRRVWRVVGAVDGCAGNTEEFSYLAAGVLPGVEQRHQCASWAGESFGGFPFSRPLALATSSPSRVRTLMTGRRPGGFIGIAVFQEAWTPAMLDGVSR